MPKRGGGDRKKGRAGRLEKEKKKERQIDGKTGRLTVMVGYSLLVMRDKNMRVYKVRERRGR